MRPVAVSGPADGGQRNQESGVSFDESPPVSMIRGAKAPGEGGLGRRGLCPRPPMVVKEEGLLLRADR
jgi:hypothetical protein